MSKRQELAALQIAYSAIVAVSTSVYSVLSVVEKPFAVAVTTSADIRVIRGKKAVRRGRNISAGSVYSVVEKNR